MNYQTTVEGTVVSYQKYGMMRQNHRKPDNPCATLMNSVQALCKLLLRVLLACDVLKGTTQSEKGPYRDAFRGRF